MSALTTGQRRALLVMGVVIVLTIALLAGFIITSMQAYPPESPLATQPASSLPTATPRPTRSLPTATPTPAPTTEIDVSLWSQVQAARLLNQIERRVETLRGLSPSAEVPLNFLEVGDMRMLMRRLYQERDPETQLLPYTALGLLPDISVYPRARQVVGFYVPEQEQLYVSTGQQEIADRDRALLLAHAYVHALQDQAFDLQAARDRARTTDAGLAIDALIEGDAVLLAAHYHEEDLTTVDWPSLEALVIQAERPDYGEALADSAAWLRVERFPYHEGRQFASALFEVDGWAGINRAYADAPQSTEQILHPERYLAEKRDVPSLVFVPDLGGALGAGWDLRLQDVLGEFVLGVYLEQTLPAAMAWRAADGWDGDAFVVWQHEEGERVRVWRTIWDAAGEADEFERALEALVPQRYLPTRPLEPGGGLPGRWWETDDGVVCVYRVARYVTFVSGPDVDVVADVIEALP